MTQLAGRVLDLTDDPDGELLKAAAEQGDIPDFVVEESHDKDLSKLADAAFALITTDEAGRKIRKYAADRPGRAWANCLYFLNCGHALDKNAQVKIAKFFQHRFDLYGITADESLSKIASGEMVLQPPTESGYGEPREEHYALIKEGHAMYPLFTEEHVKQAINYFDEQWHFFQPSDRRAFALKVAARIADLNKEAIGGATTETALYKNVDPNTGMGVAGKKGTRMLASSGTAGAGGMGSKYGAAMPAPKPFEGALENLSKAVAKGTSAKPAAAMKPMKPMKVSALIDRYCGQILDHQKLGHALHERAQLLPESDTISRATLFQLWENRGSFEPEKIAQVLESFDKKAGFDRYWDTKIIDPFSIFTKAAEEADRVVYEDNGLQVTRMMINKLGATPELLARHFDPDFAKQFAANPVAIFDSMPAPDKRALAELAAEGTQTIDPQTMAGAAPGNAGR